MITKWSAADESRINRLNRAMDKALAEKDEDKIVSVRLAQLGYSYSDYSDSSDGGGLSSSDISSILSAATSVGTTAFLATQAPQTLAPGSYIPGVGNALPRVAGTGTPVVSSSSSSTLIIVVILAIVAFFAAKEL